MTKSLSLLLNKNDVNGSLLNMSKSLASFHLTGILTCLKTNVHLQSVTVPGKKLMDTSVDHLFKNGEDVFTAGAVTQQQAEADTPTATPTAATAPSLPDTQKTRLVTEYHRQVRTCLYCRPTNIFSFVHKYFPLQKTAQPPAQASVPEEVGPVTSATGTSVTVTQDAADTAGKPKFIKVRGCRRLKNS